MTCTIYILAPSMDLKQELQKLIFLKDAVIDYINQYCDNEIVRAKEKAKRKKDISSAVCASL